MCSPSWEPHTDLHSEPDHFVLTHDALKPDVRSPSDLKPIEPERFNFCQECRVKEGYYTKLRDRYKSGKARPLKTLDLCAGGGGLSLGLTRSKAFVPMWAIEKDIAHARTYKCVTLTPVLPDPPSANLFQEKLPECNGVYTRSQRMRKERSSTRWPKGEYYWFR